MNGSLIIGTLDGANVEIEEEVGTDNMFIFGAKVHDVDVIRKQMYEKSKNFVGPQLKRVFDSIKGGKFGDSSSALGIIDNLQAGNDHYIVCADFMPYLQA